MATHSHDGLVEPIAVIGMQGRFPDAPTLERFWQNLMDGVESLRPFTEDEIRAAGVDEAWTKMPGYVPAGTVLDAVELFDAPFFGFSARDAEIIDPQQRVFLETAWEAVERAGYDPDTYPGSIGVFGGSEQSTYFYQLMKNPDRLAYADPTVLHIGNDKDYLTTLVSYKLNLKGPSVAVQTACSTSLVAVGLACQSLWSRQSDMALAGGVSVGVPQRKGYWYMPGGIFSPDGHCRTFDASGQGTVVGNGVGIVVLKRLSDAVADGDQIQALIKGAAINNDGAAKVGFSAPSVDGQVRAIRTAQRMAGIDPRTVGYVEAHGTATLLGDPIEVAALNEVFQATADRRNWCAIGSLKSNVGHLASAAGVAGLIKAVLCLKHRTLVPSLNFVTPNPQIDFASGAFYVNTGRQEWRANGGPRRAGVSSFGVGGTNAHVVLEEAPDPEASGPSRQHQLVLISAKTAAALEAATANLARHLDQHRDLDLADVAFTTQVGRRAFGHRRVLLAARNDAAGAARALAACDGQFVMTGTPASYDRPLAFMFSGQGTQYVNVCLDLYRHEPAFRLQVDDCCERLVPLLGFDLRDVLYPPAGSESQAAARLVHTSVTQPALFTIEHALARLLMGWGLTPKAMIGHSIGEYVAACISGVFSLEDALTLVAMRGQLMAEMPAGSMLAVPLSASEAELVASDGVSVAAVNAPFLSVLSGPTAAIDRLATQLADRGLHVRRLQTSHAFHSSMMDPVLERFATAVAAVERRAPVIPFVSNETGAWITAEQAQDPQYWSRHLRSAVQFAGGVDELMRVPDAILLEVGPGHTLQTLARQQPASGSGHLVVGSIRAAQDPTSDVEYLLRTVGQLWLNGQRVDWRAFTAGEKRRRADLPTYPFERQKYWIGPGESLDAAAGRPRDVADWFYIPSWKPDVGGTTADTTTDESRWLIFSDGLGLGDEMARQLRLMGHRVATVMPAPGFARVDEQTFGVSPDVLDDYVALLDALGEELAPPQFVAHLWSVTGSADDEFDAAQGRGVRSLTCLAQALEKARMTGSVNVAWVSDHLQSVLGDEAICPPKATALGACKVLPQEYPNLRCRAIDVALEPSPQPDAKLAEQLIHELIARAFEAVVAYRNGRRWIQTFEPHPIPSVERPRTIRDAGVFVITGGLGNIGLVAAEVLARASAGARLALIGRSAFPDREDWDRWLSEGVDDAITGKIRRLKALEDLGAQVHVFSVDAADADQMAAVIAQIEAVHGPINGIVHGAGNTSADGFMPAREADADGFERQLRPKVRGLLALEEIMRGKPVDFWLLLSSISGVLGGLNLLPYASANVFLDAFAARQNQSGTPGWISVAWDAWQFPRDERAFRASNPKWFEYVLPGDGASALQRVLDRAPGQIVVSATSLADRLAKWVRLESIHDAPAGASAAASIHQRPNLSSQYVAPRTETERAVANTWEQLLGVAPIGIHDKFFELGGHSLLAIQLIAKIRESFQIELPPQRLFEAPTVAQFAAAIDADVQAMKDQASKQDEARLAELLDLVEGLTEEQVAEMLARARGVEEQAHG